VSAEPPVSGFKCGTVPDLFIPNPAPPMKTKETFYAIDGCHVATTTSTPNGDGRTITVTVTLETFPTEHMAEEDYRKKTAKPRRPMEGE
jgi:hypothetical protein